MITLCPHGPLTRLSDSVWCMAGNAHSLERPRRMTIFRLPSGELVVHGGIRLADEEMGTIETLGKVAYYLLVPNVHHDPDAAWFASRYPAARCLAPSAEADTFRRITRVDGTFESDWPPELSAVLEHHTVGGTRFTETVFFHVPSRTLVIVDLAFNMTEDHFEGRPFGRFLMKLNRAYERFGITRLTETLVTDPALLRRSLELILRWDFERVIVSHGTNVETDAKRVFRGGFPKYLPAE
jgi:hypothetical protein